MYDYHGCNKERIHHNSGAIDDKDGGILLIEVTVDIQTMKF